MKSILRPKKEKTDGDIKKLEKLVSRRQKIFFGEFISPNELLNKQVAPRLDLIVRDLAVGQILGENTKGLKLWKKLGARTRMEYQYRLDKLHRLITSFKKCEGYLTQYPMSVDKNYQMRGGAHRMVLSKRYNILEIPIIGNVTLDYRKGVYNIQ